jgi:hypothetical protein
MSPPRPGRVMVNTLYLKVAASFSEFACAAPGIMGSMIAREASLRAPGDGDHHFRLKTTSRSD